MPHRQPLLIPVVSLALAAGVLANPAPAVDPAPVAPVRAASAEPAPASRLEGEAALQDAIAAAVTAALVAQFPGQRVELQLHALEANAVSIRDREVHGNGRMRFDGDADWLPFGFRALYDTDTGVALSPRLSLGSGGAEAAGAGTPLDAALARSLADEARRRLATEFPDQRVVLDLASAQARPLSARYLGVDAAGSAAFGREGTTPARIGAVYDLKAARWLQVDYELGPSATASAPDVTASAAQH